MFRYELTIVNWSLFFYIFKSSFLRWSFNLLPQVKAEAEKLQPKEAAEARSDMFVVIYVIL